MLNNNSVQNILNSAYLQIVGSAPVGGNQIDLSSFVDVGNDPTLPTFKEQFTKALVIGAVKNFFISPNLISTNPTILTHRFYNIRLISKYQTSRHHTHGKSLRTEQRLALMKYSCR